ncbi:hypothetical protein BHM03_00022279 [Ensete ventricosum]|nr:hypothetical protein BHM03_00022279 [Ensete ventricosum]
MLGWSQVRASGQDSDDVVGASREFVEGRPMFGRCYRELTESSQEVCREVCHEFADRLSRARREFTGRIPESSSGVHRQVIESSPGVRRKNAGSLLGVRRRKSGAHRGFIGKILGVRRRDDRTMNIVH